MSGQPEVNDKQKIPLGVVFISIGLVLLMFVVLVWGFLPTALPEQLQLAELPAIMNFGGGGVEVLPTLIPTDMPPWLSDRTLLPETTDEEPVVVATSAVVVAPPHSKQPARLVIPAIEMD